jgi:hypothetical protein
VKKKGDKLEIGFKADTLKALTRRACSIQKLLTERSILKKSEAPWLLRVSGAKLWSDNKPEKAGRLKFLARHSLLGRHY